MDKKIERAVDFLPRFREDLAYWVKTDRKSALRTLELVEAVVSDPFAGIGKPEPLKHELAGAWSRRLTQEHRLIYRVTETRIYFLQARYHYE
jgi:toxin YoeB